MSGILSTSVLDTMHGHPAEGMRVSLSRIHNDGEIQLMTWSHTNEHGRTDTPLLSGDNMQVGIYELSFKVNEYFRAKGIELPDPPFLTEVPVRFSVYDSEANYHVPLHCTPWSYSIHLER